MDARTYNQIHNEGGEGYVPSYLTTETEEPLIWRLRGQRDSIVVAMAGTSTADPRYADLSTKLAEIKAAIAREETR